MHHRSGPLGRAVHCRGALGGAPRRVQMHTVDALEKNTKPTSTLTLANPNLGSRKPITPEHARITHHTGPDHVQNTPDHAVRIPCRNTYGSRIKPPDRINTGSHVRRSRRNTPDHVRITRRITPGSRRNTIHVRITYHYRTGSHPDHARITLDHGSTPDHARMFTSITSGPDHTGSRPEHPGSRPRSGSRAGTRTDHVSNRQTGSTPDHVRRSRRNTPDHKPDHARITPEHVRITRITSGPDPTRITPGSRPVARITLDHGSTR